MREQANTSRDEVCEEEKKRKVQKLIKPSEIQKKKRLIE